MRKIILASHGSMAEGVLSAAKMIMGDCEEIQALGLDHYESPTEIARRIERQVTAEPDCDFMIFCDIHGGSVHNQLTELCRYPNVYLVGGMTLSMILECHLNVQDISTMELLETPCSRPRTRSPCCRTSRRWNKLKREWRMMFYGRAVQSG